LVLESLFKAKKTEGERERKRERQRQRDRERSREKPDQGPTGISQGDRF
jgi:hypothetical protein